MHKLLIAALSGVTGVVRPISVSCSEGWFQTSYRVSRDATIVFRGMRYRVLRDGVSCFEGWFAKKKCCVLRTYDGLTS